MRAPQPATTLADEMNERLSAASASGTVITLTVDRAEPITGTLTVHGRTSEERFCGWMELIAAITAGCRSSIEPGEHGSAGGA
jgi:hypothetical protein